MATTKKPTKRAVSKTADKAVKQPARKKAPPKKKPTPKKKNPNLKGRQPKTLLDLYPNGLRFTEDDAPKIIEGLINSWYGGRSLQQSLIDNNVNGFTFYHWLQKGKAGDKQNPYFGILYEAYTDWRNYLDSQIPNIKADIANGLTESYRKDSKGAVIESSNTNSDRLKAIALIEAANEKKNEFGKSDMEKTEQSGINSPKIDKDKWLQRYQWKPDDGNEVPGQIIDKSNE